MTRSFRLSALVGHKARPTAHPTTTRFSWRPSGASAVVHGAAWLREAPQSVRRGLWFRSTRGTGCARVAGVEGVTPPHAARGVGHATPRIFVAQVFLWRFRHAMRRGKRWGTHRGG